MTAQTARPAGESIGDYYSATQLRADRWSALREACESLHQVSRNARESAKYIHTIERLFEALAPIELYWAFPGRSGFDYLRRLLASQHHEDLAFSTRRIARALTSGAGLAGASPVLTGVSREATPCRSSVP